MRKLAYANLLGVLLAPIGLMGADVLGAELEGAIQYPPPSVGADAQPPPPAKTLPQTISPRRFEQGVSGSKSPPEHATPYCAASDPLGSTRRIAWD